jgi:hypothetical protein
MKAIDWKSKVAEDFRERILVDSDSSILAFKANRDRFTDIKNQTDYAGLPHLGSYHSEDALTWNVFRSLQKHGCLNIITKELGIGDSRGMLLWTIAPEPDEISCKLQYATGSIIRKFDGILPGQIGEPDVIILGSNGLAIIECKLSEPDKTPSHMWEGSIESVRKRRHIYEKEIPGLFKEFTTDEMIVPVYQLTRMAFYAMKIAEIFAVIPLVVSLVNERNCSQEIRKFGKSSNELWDVFYRQVLGTSSPQCKALTWQNLRTLLQGHTLGDLSLYLSTHPCI